MRTFKRKSPQQPQSHAYQPKPLPFRTPLNGISDRTLKNHHDKLYISYVDKKNEIENRLEEFGRAVVLNDGQRGNATYSELRALKESETFAVNGTYLHEWYFEILGGDGTLEGADELVGAITAKFGSVEAFITYISECAMAARGWTVLCWDTKENRLWIYNCDAHNQGGVWGALPIIVIDVYEHAYFMDYGADRQAYLKAFWKNFNWRAANDLFKRASSIRL